MLSIFSWSLGFKKADRLRIAIVIHSMAGGGAERVSVTLASAWLADGHSIMLITFENVGADVYVLDDRITRVALGLANNSHGLIDAAVANIKRILALRHRLILFKPDLVLGMMTGASVATLLATRGMKVPVLVSERTYPPMLPVGRFWGAMRRLTYPWAERVVMLSSTGLEWLQTSIPKARGVVIPNPVTYRLPINNPIVNPDSYIKAGRKLVLSVGRMDSGKQFDQLIAAFAAISQRVSDWDLVILGDGPERQALEAQIASLGLATRVMLPGRVGNVGQWYERAELYVLSSRFEGFPNVLAEAMAHGCAAISYDCDTGPRDIIREGLDGLLVRPVGDVQRLQSAMAILMEDDQMREAMTIRAREVLERFSIEIVMNKWKKLLY
jgi:glycosyltransferase involved in cell wall biosynthesis